jgi:hypothetical protein
MKRLDELTVQDLHDHPVWRYWSATADDADAEVETADGATVSENDPAVFLVATQFVLADGSEHCGFCSPQDLSGFDYIQPVILTAGGQIRLWFEGPASSHEQNAWYSYLGKVCSAVFPISFVCAVPVDGQTVRGVIEERQVFGHAT